MQVARDENIFPGHPESDPQNIRSSIEDLLDHGIFFFGGKIAVARASDHKARVKLANPRDGPAIFFVRRAKEIHAVAMILRRCGKIMEQVGRRRAIGNFPAGDQPGRPQYRNAVSRHRVSVAIGVPKYAVTRICGNDIAIDRSVVTGRRAALARLTAVIEHQLHPLPSGQGRNWNVGNDDGRDRFRRVG